MDRRHRAYRRLLKLLPERFRARWGEDMEDLFAHRMSMACDSRTARFKVWVRAVLDVARVALVERFHGAAPSRPSIHSPATAPMTTGDIFHSLHRDLAYGLRQMLRAPGFHLMAAAVLALAIGLNTAVFSAVQALVLDPPVHRRDQ